MSVFTKIFNGRIITPQRIMERGTVLLSGGKITAISEYDIDVPHAMVIDAQGMFIAPGFIDLHVHGGGGSDFMDNTVESFVSIAATHLRYGTTAMWPTTLT